MNDTRVPSISVRRLSHHYGRQQVLRDVSFEVMPGEIFGFIGPNGAGKTTTIRVMATLLEPMAGEVLVDGFDVAIDPGEVRRRIGYMPDHAGVYERISVREYLEFFRDAYGVPKADVVDVVLELTDLTRLDGQLVAALSKGLRQRLGIARILLHDPNVLILDEPASDLDPRARIEVRDLLLELKELGKTIFLSSHILTELSDICDSVGILERGQLVVAGPISEIAERLQLAASNPGADGPSAESSTPGGAIVPAAARKRLKLRVLGDARTVVALVEGGGGVLAVHAEERGQLIVDYQGTDQFVADLVRHLVERGVGVVGVQSERNELERIFLEVTRSETG